MEKNIFDKEFRKIVLNLYENEGYDRKAIAKAFDVKNYVIEDIIQTFKRLPLDADLKEEPLSEKEKEMVRENLNNSCCDLIVPLKRNYRRIKLVADNMKRTEKRRRQKKEESINRVARNNKRMTNEEKEFIDEAIENGDDINDIARALERSVEAIKSYMYKNKLYYKKEELEEGYKRCRSCNKVKHVSEFVKNKRSEDGFGIYCKECNAKKYREYYKRKKEENK